MWVRKEDIIATLKYIPEVTSEPCGLERVIEELINLAREMLHLNRVG